MGRKVVIASGTRPLQSRAWPGPARSGCPRSGAGGQVVFPAPKAGEFDIRTLFPQADFRSRQQRLFRSGTDRPLPRARGTSKSTTLPHRGPPRPVSWVVTRLRPRPSNCVAAWLAPVRETRHADGAKGGVYLAGALHQHRACVGAARFRAAFKKVRRQRLFAKHAHKGDQDGSERRSAGARAAGFSYAQSQDPFAARDLMRVTNRVREVLGYYDGERAGREGKPGPHSHA